MVDAAKLVKPAGLCMPEYPGMPTYGGAFGYGSGGNCFPSHSSDVFSSSHRPELAQFSRTYSEWTQQTCDESNDEAETHMKDQWSGEAFVGRDPDSMWAGMRPHLHDLFGSASKEHELMVRQATWVC